MLKPFVVTYSHLFPSRGIRGRASNAWSRRRAVRLTLPARGQWNVKLAKEQRGGNCKGYRSCHLSILETSHELRRFKILKFILR